MNIKSYEDLEAVKKEFLKKEKEFQYTAHICYGAGCISSDCREVKEAFITALENEKLMSKVRINLTGCMGACSLGPTLIINPGNILYCSLKPSDMRGIVKDHIKKGKIVEKLCFKDTETGKAVPHLNDIDFFRHQKKNVLQNCGIIDFASIEEYIARDGYFAIEKALKLMTPEDVIAEILKSGLRGRGGGGFRSG